MFQWSPKETESVARLRNIFGNGSNMGSHGSDMVRTWVLMVRTWFGHGYSWFGHGYSWFGHGGAFPDGFGCVFSIANMTCSMSFFFIVLLILP